MKPSEHLRQFIYRAQVVSLYRKFLREMRDVPQPSKGELKQEVRRNFEEFRHVKEQPNIKFLLSDGRKKLQQFGEMIGFRR